MNRRLGLVSLACLLAASTFLGSNMWSTAEANTGDELKEQIEQSQRDQEKKLEEAEQTEQELAEVEEEIVGLQDEIRELDEKTQKTNEDIRVKQDEIDETNENIEDLREEIEILQERIKERDELLKDRVNSMYKNGGTVNYLEVLLGAQNFGDLIERVNALSTISRQDRNILEQHIADKEALENAKVELETQLENLETQMNELEDLRADLEAQTAEKDRLVDSLEEKGASLKDAIVSLEEEQSILAAQEAAAKEELEEWEEEQRRLEEERKRKEEEERQRQKEEEERKKKEEEEAAAAAQSSNSGSSNSESSNSGSSNTGSSSSSGSSSSPDRSASASAPSDSGGTLGLPATGRVTSEYGPRWGRVHHGIDIGQGGRSNVPIVAAESGTVIRAEYMNGYGNTVMITHNVNGKTITTLYAHMDSISVSQGQRVSRGQNLGIMGNTGASQGPHLHFEVHEGGWNGAKSNSVDPRKYVNF
ncbi:murein hydrolase activator EnvC family protein [Alteribacter keqinensis]|uniref:Peptidase M23 n=1 Tax=Alteribacter keqinensis TaxID=2483800 RepID=A0A3M7TS34_9BACI|nr:peptidoglycan DD-metalloendopeptidase family protein [Alteribacter keqinensis]RNA67532.1 peptidase M23 [Alteribacter keqinensis]